MPITVRGRVAVATRTRTAWTGIIPSVWSVGGAQNGTICTCSPAMDSWSSSRTESAIWNCSRQLQSGR